jgi:hypothetical protein
VIGRYTAGAAHQLAAVSASSKLRALRSIGARLLLFTAPMRAIVPRRRDKAALSLQKLPGAAPNHGVRLLAVL